jgi:dipeptidyl aminopeptidase/acylaminoacyl peptidase
MTMIDQRALGAIEQHVADYFETIYRPGADRLHAIIHVSPHPTDGRIAFSGPVYRAGGGFPLTRTLLLDGGREPTWLGSPGASLSDPRWSPDGRLIAFLSDEGHGAGNLQLVVADAAAPARHRATVVLDGEAVEGFAWSPDGTRILLQTADAGSDAAGSAATARIGSAAEAERPSWAPAVETSDHADKWRRARIWDIVAGRLTDIGAAGQNVWECDWLGNDQVVAILSANPGEGGWYQTHAGVAPAAGGTFTRLANSDLELAGIKGSPDGRHVALIEGRFHRTVQLGNLVLIDAVTGALSRPDIDIQMSALAWREPGRLFFTGFAAPETVAGTLEIDGGHIAIEWRTPGTAGRKVPFAAPTGRQGLLAPAHGFGIYQQLRHIDADGASATLVDFADPPVLALQQRLGSAAAIEWPGAEGMPIKGYLAKPAGVERPPLVLFIHGGPSHLFRDSWTFDNPFAALLVSAGYAVLASNPRGSSGRGLDFASRVIGDWGGSDHIDLLAGVDHVVAEHGVDPDRLFVIGGSYGGFMTSWLVTRTDRFRAACAMAPVTDMRSQYFTAHHPEFLTLYTQGSPYEVGGIFDQRSPLRHADKVVTPTLLIAGEIDHTTPSSQAVQFYRALALRGVPTELALYPEEGHAPLRYEAQVDQGIRILRWFRQWDRPAGETHLG